MITIFKIGTIMRKKQQEGFYQLAHLSTGKSKEITMKGTSTPHEQYCEKTSKLYHSIKKKP